MALSYAASRADEEWGEKLAEGIYILNRKKKPVDKSKLLLGRGDVRLYPDEVKRLRKCIDSLLQSNRQLQRGLDSDPEEVEYSLAIRENTAIVDTMRGQIAAMEKELRDKGFGSLVEPEQKCTQHLLQDAEEDGWGEGSEEGDAAAQSAEAAAEAAGPTQQNTAAAEPEAAAEREGVAEAAGSAEQQPEQRHADPEAGERAAEAEKAAQPAQEGEGEPDEVFL